MSKRENLEFDFDGLDIDVDAWVNRLHNYITSDEFKDFEDSIKQEEGS